MKLKEHLKISFRSLRSNPMRSVLTMLGIIIGVSSVIVMIALGNGAKKQTQAQIQTMGTNLITVFVGGWHHAAPGASAQEPLSEDDYESLKKEMKYAAEISPEMSSNLQVKYSNVTLSASIRGVLPSYEAVKNLKVAKGRFITDSDNKSSKKVCVLGGTVASELFKSIEPVGNKIRIKNHRFEVIGVLETKGEGGFGGDDDTVVIPFNTAKLRLIQRANLSRISIMADKEENTDAAIAEAETILRKRRNITDPSNDNFMIRSQKELLDTMTGVMNVMTTLLAGIALVSLIVGGIGIMNIMLVTVTERTREIGIRKAIGAKSRDILLQFMIESMTLSLLGGLTGIALGLGISYMVPVSTGYATAVTVNSIVLAFTFSASIGLFFGIYPSRKASKLNPIDALRYE